MGIQSDWIRYGLDQEYLGYVASPDHVSEPLEAIIVIQEIWGVDEHIQDVVRRFASAGYVAFAPDLYAKHGDRPSSLAAGRIEQIKGFLDSLPPTVWHNPEEREAALNRLPSNQKMDISETFRVLFGGLHLEQYLPQLVQTSLFLRNQYSKTVGKGVASVGFCMGGSLSALLACHDPELRGAGIFYGSAPKEDLISKIQCPVVGFYGEEDKRITDGVEGFASAMKSAGKSFEFHIYKGANHAFFNDTRSSYHVLSARDAYFRMLQFFHQVLS
ncbi:dienelactone hydrolase family protein [Sulfoacidibacillus thermotolerans]|uniref:Dienelactone hydrolase domain-containing protein n=1 Tax=Sulfoacidibacillus thermotolerans TaxID=1765684 RepID=A0A2U3D884_SULT2|nr:dienelactone hydrolase family protein [Sulfoacidibacillus thermotolerans]PWI57493.1 hypothetical protein BM613_08455 [Sulfoacidibacillus thermotolerans]